MFQMSLRNVDDFISGVKEAINTIREDIDKEADEFEEDDQVEFSIPQRKLMSRKKLDSLSSNLPRLMEAKKASSSAEESKRLENEYEYYIGTIHKLKRELENYCLQEKIINRRTLKLIQMLCQLTVKNGIDDETITWSANFIIEHIKNKDTENMDICLSIIVDILLYDKDLSASLLRIYQSLLGMSNISSGDFTDENPNSAQIITIIKALYDMFCILENYGLDCFEDYSMQVNAKGELVDNYSIEENDRIRVKLSNYLLGTIIKKFLFC